jgi:hypothetical protein
MTRVAYGYHGKLAVSLVSQSATMAIRAAAAPYKHRPQNGHKVNAK